MSPSFNTSQLSFCLPLTWRISSQCGQLSQTSRGQELCRLDCGSASISQRLPQLLLSDSCSWPVPCLNMVACQPAPDCLPSRRTVYVATRQSWASIFSVLVRLFQPQFPQFLALVVLQTRLLTWVMFSAPEPQGTIWWPFYLHMTWDMTVFVSKSFLRKMAQGLQGYTWCHQSPDSTRASDFMTTLWSPVCLPAVWPYDMMALEKFPTHYPQLLPLSLGLASKGLITWDLTPLAVKNHASHSLSVFPRIESQSRLKVLSWESVPGGSFSEEFSVY